MIIEGQRTTSPNTVLQPVSTIRRITNQSYKTSIRHTTQSQNPSLNPMIIGKSDHFPPFSYANHQAFPIFSHGFRYVLGSRSPAWKMPQQGPRVARGSPPCECHGEMGGFFKGITGNLRWNIMDMGMFLVISWDFLWKFPWKRGTLMNI